MLIILRLAVLPHKHPHELLDSVVKERVIKSFVSTEAHILQQPHSPSSDFENFFSTSTTCAFDLLFSFSSAGGEFYSVSNHCQPPSKPLPTTSIEAPTRSNHHLVSPAHSTQLSLLCNPYFHSNLLIKKDFSARSAPEEVRIIGPSNLPSRLISLHQYSGVVPHSYTGR